MYISVCTNWKDVFFKLFSRCDAVSNWRFCWWWWDGATVTIVELISETNSWASMLRRPTERGKVIWPFGGRHTILYSMGVSHGFSIKFKRYWKLLPSVYWYVKCIDCFIFSSIDIICKLSNKLNTICFLISIRIAIIIVKHNAYVAIKHQMVSGIRSIF